MAAADEPAPPNPFVWTDEEQRQHERALDRISAMIVESLAQGRLTTDPAERAALEAWRVRLDQERKTLGVHDHAEIERIITEYDKQLRAWRAARGR